MRKTIYKYDLTAAFNQNGVISIKAPKDAKWLYVAVQPHTGLCAWAQVNIDEPAEQVPHTLHIIGTGHTVPDNVAYIGSVIDGAFVWHVYAEQLY